MYFPPSTTTVLLSLSLLAPSSLAAPMSSSSSASSSHFLPRSQTLTITTPLGNASSTAMLALVHNPSYMINANGLVTSSTQTSSDPITFEISDDLIKLPFGLPGLFKTTYTATFVNSPSGLVTRSTAGGGLLVLTGTWDVTEAELSEEVLMEGNGLVVEVAKGFVERAHTEMHAKMVRDAAAASANTGFGGTR